MTREFFASIQLPGGQTATWCVCDCVCNCVCNCHSFAAAIKAAIAAAIAAVIAIAFVVAKLLVTFSSARLVFLGVGGFRNS